MKDNRDPSELGNKLLHVRKTPVNNFDRSPLSFVADHAPLRVRDHVANPGPIEKYGDPTKLPSTMP